MISSVSFGDSGSSYLVIPARMASTRLPRKMLLRETGKSLIQHTYEAARGARLPADVIVATDHAELFEEVVRFGGRAVMTPVECPTGTDRVAEVARQLPDAEIIVNVQGDEPLVSGRSIDMAIELLRREPQASIATLATPIRSRAQLEDPACVKVVFDPRGRALYFSRSPIPHPRGPWDDAWLNPAAPAFFQHVGLYAFRREFLLEFGSLPPSRLEQLERLEQLRALEAGRRIVVAVVAEHSFGIDTAEDYKAFVERWRNGGPLADG